MIHFYVGKPRNGKSLRAMMRIWEELTTGTREIHTNMVLDLDVLQALLIVRGFPQVDVRRRIRFLTDAETKDFWLYRARGLVLAKPEDYDAKQGADVDYSPCFDEAYAAAGDIGVLNVIDEVHTHWRARGWSGTPRHVDFYNSQHGKLSDTIIFITQNTKLVDQNFIRLAQDFGYCRNHRLEKHGKFRGDNKFTMHVYPGPVSNGNEVTLNEETYKLDLPLAECYDTSAGVGMPGGGKADAGFRAKGIPLKFVWVILAVVLVVLLFAVRQIIPMLTEGFVGPAIKPSLPSSAAIPGPPAPRQPSAASSSPAPGVVPSVKSPGAAVPGLVQDKPQPPVFVTGVLSSGSRFLVNLSDGRRYSQRDRSVQRLDERGVLIGGVLYPYAAAYSPPPLPRVPARPVDDDPPQVADKTPQSQPSDSSSSWRTDPDGVQRLKQPLTW